MGQSAAREAKSHEKRISRCLQSFQQLQADIRHINLHCAAEFARPQTELESAVSASSGGDTGLLLLQFRPFTKLSKKSALPWLWKLNDNVIITATLTPKSVADAAIVAAASPGGAPPAASAFNTSYPSWQLTIREFYHVFLFYCDNLKVVTTLREQILKIEHPEAWNAAQDARRQATLAATVQQRKQTAGGPDDATSSAEANEEEKADSLPKTSSSLSLAGRQSSSPQDCSICLTAPDEEGLGNELVVLPCLHAFCSECITDWKTQSSTCPLCRRELTDDANDHDTEWILTSPNLVQLRTQYQKTLETPYIYVSERPSFPPVDNKRGVKSAGDALSLAVGEVIDVFQPSQRRQQQQQRKEDVTAAAVVAAAVPAPAVAPAPALPAPPAPAAALPVAEPVVDPAATATAVVAK